MKIFPLSQMMFLGRRIADCKNQTYIDNEENIEIVSYWFRDLLRWLYLSGYKTAAQYINNNLFHGEINCNTMNRDTYSNLDNKIKIPIQNIPNYIDSLIQIIDTEDSEYTAFITEPKRLSMKYLVQDQGKIIESGIYRLLPEQARNDFNEACQCIACDLPTAAIFHLMRCLEFIGKKIAEKENVNLKKNNTFGKFSKELKLSITKEIKIIGEELFHISQTYRNPTLHPNYNPNIEEAQNLLYSTAALIPKLIKKIQTYDTELDEDAKKVINDLFPETAS